MGSIKTCEFGVGPISDKLYLVYCNLLQCYSAYSLLFNPQALLIMVLTNSFLEKFISLVDWKASYSWGFVS